MHGWALYVDNFHSCPVTIKHFIIVTWWWVSVGTYVRTYVGVWVCNKLIELWYCAFIAVVLLPCHTLRNIHWSTQNICPQLVSIYHSALVGIVECVSCDSCPPDSQTVRTSCNTHTHTHVLAFLHSCPAACEGPHCTG